MGTPDFTTAIQKADMKRAIAAKLASLPRDAQRDVLADLLLALDEKTLPANGSVQPNKPHKESPGRPKGAINTNGESRTAVLVAALKAEPGASIGKLALATYGKDDKVRKGNLPALMTSLKKQGRVKNVGSGKWEVVAG